MQIPGGRTFLAEGKARQGPKAGMCLRCLCLARWQNREEGGGWKGVRAVRGEVKAREGAGCMQMIARSPAFILCELEGFEQRSDRTTLAVCGE